MEHVLIHSPGFPKLNKWTNERIVPSQAVIAKMFFEYAQRKSANLIAVDLNGDTTDIYSVFDGIFNRSLNAGIGLTYGICNVLKETGIEKIQRWLPGFMDERKLRNLISNMMIYPTQVYSKENNSITAAIAREIIRLSFEEHKVIASRLKGVVIERTLVEKLSQILEPTMINMMKTNLLIGKGDLFREQTVEDSALILIDSLQPEGVTEIYIDPENLAASLGSLIEHDKETALTLYSNNALCFVGTCIAPKGVPKLGQDAFRIELETSRGKQVNHFKSGMITVLPVTEKGTIEITIYPNRLDLGAGRGKKVKQEINCTHSQLGIIIDTRGRPLNLYHQPMKLNPVKVTGSYV
jgi:hypothetical protein